MRKANYPTQSELLFPLLETLVDSGGAAPQDVYPVLARAVGLPPEVRDEFTTGSVRVWDRHVRWTQQYRGQPAQPVAGHR